MRCDGCENWTTKRVTRYSNNEEVVNWAAPEGKGRCSHLDIDTPAEFGCLKFAAGGADHVKREWKNGEPWQHWVMVSCPDCGGDAKGAVCHRCAGTGRVRSYDDGYVGEEQTRLHPKEKQNAEPLKCRTCAAVVQITWKACPMCGNRLEPPAETEYVDGLGNAGGDYRNVAAEAGR